MDGSRTALLALGIFIATTVGVPQIASASCVRCTGSEECQTHCSSAENSVDQARFNDLVCMPLSCGNAVIPPTGVCGQGGFVSCAPQIACCLPDGCLDLSPSDCANAGGVSAGDGTFCPRPQGIQCTACTSAACADTVCTGSADSGLIEYFFAHACAQQCINLAGSTVACGGANPEFDNCTTPTGGCNVPNVGCILTAAINCTTLGGTYKGDGTKCADPVCEGVSTATPTGGTPESTPTATATSTATSTATATATATATSTSTSTATATATRTNTPIGQGGSCGVNAPCPPGLFCVDGVCCNQPCTGPEESCIVPGRVGECVSTSPAPAPAISETGRWLATALLIAVAAVALLRRRSASR